MKSNISYQLLFKLFIILLVTQQVISSSLQSKYPNNCKIYNLINQYQCQLCQDNYSLTKDKKLCILSTISHCQYYDNNKCYLCQASYQLIQTITAQKLKNISMEIQIPRNLENNNFFKNYNQNLIQKKQQCVLDNSGCIKRSANAQTCNQCSYGKFLVQGSCQGVLNCKIYQNNQCLRCENGYKKQNNKCIVDIKNPISGCQQIDSLYQNCQRCQNDYQKIGLLCIPNDKIIKNCAVYNYFQNCLICRNGLQIYQNQCLTQSQITQKIIQKVKYWTIRNQKSTQQNSKHINYIQYAYKVQNNKDNINNKSINKNQQQDKKQIIVRGLNFNSQSSNFQSGCFYSKNDICLKCLKQYKLVGGYCIIQNCQKIQNHQCKQCKFGYELLKDSNKCRQKIEDIINLKLFPNNRPASNYQLTSKYIQNCKLFNLKGQCTKCNDDYFIKNGTCYKNSNCKTVNVTNGQCLTCYPGYSLVDNRCIQSQKDPNCKRFSNEKCEECTDRFYLKIGSNQCIPINKKCNKYNIFTGKCLSCYDGYVLQNQECILNLSYTPRQEQKTNQNKLTKTFLKQQQQNKSKQKNINCKIFDYQTKVCKQCYQGFFLKTENNYQKCIQLDPQCKSHNLQNGQCLTCFNGYKIDNGKCVLSQFKNQINKLSGLQKTKSNLTTDNKYYTQNTNKVNKINNFKNKILQNCRIMKENMCVQCSFGFYLQDYQNCIQVDSICKKFDYQLKICLQCYDGYIVDYSNNKKCILKPNNNSNPFCKVYNLQTNKCSKCINRYYLNSQAKNKQQECQAVSIICDEYDQNTGKCKSCIQGYIFQDQCIRPNLGVDINCEYYEKGFCVKCKQNYELNNFKCSLNYNININQQNQYKGLLHQ